MQLIKKLSAKKMNIFSSRLVKTVLEIKGKQLFSEEKKSSVTIR